MFPIAAVQRAQGREGLTSMKWIQVQTDTQKSTVLIEFYQLVKNETETAKRLKEDSAYLNFCGPEAS